MNDRVEHEIELTIEAVTGTVYDLCVSPFETVLGIKMKIQRLEGIPVYQQHLVYDGLELQDDYCLEDYGVRSGCQLKLVLAMRGGPIHANRIQVEDETLLELAEYLDTQSGDEEETQLTVMLLSDGNIGFLKAESPIEASNERMSRSCTPIIGSQTKLTTLENRLMKEKMSDLQAKLRDLRLGRAEHASLKLPHRKWKEVVILDSRTSRQMSPAGLTPCQAQTWRRHDYRAHSNTGVQRQLRFTPTERSNELPPLTPHRKLDNAPVLRHRRADQQHLAGSNSRTMTEPGHGGIQHPSLLATDNGTSKPSTIRREGEHFLPELLPRRRSLLQAGPSPSHHPPLIQSSIQRARRNRCMQCGRRMRLAATFTCRCGGMFCATHRYAEMHPCTFNYKAHGREIIARKNPLITAPKLPKI